MELRLRGPCRRCGGQAPRAQRGSAAAALGLELAAISGLAAAFHTDRERRGSSSAAGRWHSTHRNGCAIPCRAMADRLLRITRALLSVSDKTGIVDFAGALAQRGIELISTGGTRKALADAGRHVIDVSQRTGFPEMMDGRVKTVPPKVHGGLLALRGNKDHAAAMQTHGIRPIDLLVVNLYPFESTVAKGAAFDTCVENIDIGGPAMIRAAAKNHADVTVVVDPADYALVLAELQQHQGGTTLELRRRLAAKAYARTATYDAAIANWFAQRLEDPAPVYRAIGGQLS